MTVAVALGLFVAGAAMGFVNNLAGAGGLIALVAFEGLVGLAPTEANIAMRPAAIALSIAGFLGFLSRGLKVPRHVWVWGLATVPGAVAGSLLAISVPVWLYQTVLALVVVYLVARMAMPRRTPTAAAGPEEDLPPAGAIPPLPSILWFMAVGLHMGFIQVGTGLVAIAALSTLHSRDLVVVNAAKMVLVFCAALCSVSILAAGGEIAWSPALALAVGAGVGSFVAGRVSVKRGHGFIRGAVLAVCAFTLGRILWQVLA